jgi:hypothetical protein
LGSGPSGNGKETTWSFRLCDNVSFHWGNMLRGFHTTAAFCFSRLMRRPDHDDEVYGPSPVVDPERDDPAAGIAGEVVVENFPGIPPPTSAWALEVAERFLFHSNTLGPP